MFNLITRFQTVVSNALTSSVIIIVLIAASSFVQLLISDAWSTGSLIENIRPQMLIKRSFNYGAVNRKPKENSRIVFDLDADLTPLFNWNTKQVFVYLTAEYPGKSNQSSNKVTYWDKIITRKDEKVLHLKNMKSHYSVWDVEKSFRGRDAQVKLEWNIQPYVGPLLYGETDAISKFQFPLPESKGKSS